MDYQALQARVRDLKALQVQAMRRGDKEKAKKVSFPKMVNLYKFCIHLLWSHCLLWTTKATQVHSFDFEIKRMSSDQIALHSVRY